MNDFEVIQTRYGARQGTLKSYVLGYVLSLALTFTPYFLVTERVFTSTLLIVSILVFALVQLGVQLFFFLHLKSESRPRWNSLILALTAFIVVVVVVGSLWIMDNLNNNMMMTPEEMGTLMESMEFENQAGGF